MPGFNKPSDDRRELEDTVHEMKSEFDTRILWLIIPVCVGGGISMFSNFEQDIQIIIWGVMFLIAGGGIWTHNARKVRKQREVLEDKRWQDFSDTLESRFDDIDKRFDEVERRFDEVDKRFDTSEDTDKTLLRNELLKMHREYYQVKGYITVEALEYAERLHDQYNAVGGNDLGDQMYDELLGLPKYQSEAMVPPEMKAKGADLCMATGEPYQVMHPGAANGQ